MRPHFGRAGCSGRTRTCCLRSRTAAPPDGPVRYLDTHRGTKGGRDRLLPIDTPQRKAAVAQACRVAIGPDDRAAG